MKAYELFCQDVKGDELIRANTDRRAYYNTLRQMLRTELMAGAECELLAHYARRLEDGAPGYMYLLDAAALWECYEAALSGPRRFPRDIGQGLPFPLANGGRLSWMEVQRQSDLGTLPVAVLDEALRARISALVAYMNSQEAECGGLEANVPDPRARLAMAEARVAGRIPAPGAAPAAQAEEDAPQSAQLQEQITRLQAERQSLQAELEHLKNQPRQGNEELVQLVDMLLHSQMAEAAALARRLGGEVKESVQRAQELQQTVTQLQEQLHSAQEQQQADLAQVAALRTQQQTALQCAREAREACEQAQADALAAQQARQEAEKQLGQARETLMGENARLRELQGRMARTHSAAELMRRQADRLS